MSDKKRVAIIGGGISGLAAAHRLHELDRTLELALNESSRSVGRRDPHGAGPRPSTGPLGPLPSGGMPITGRRRSICCGVPPG